jgi:hypothetical protein
MSLQKVMSYIPSLRTLFTVVISSILGAFVSFGVFVWINSPIPKPSPPHDARFVALGKSYLAQLGKSYARAWEDGAILLDSGQGLSTTLEAVSKSWTSNRTQLFDQVVTPEFGKLLPESTGDPDVPPQARAALAAAWRGFALGLRH